MIFNTVITFPSTNYALRTEHLLKGLVRQMKVIPSPRELTSSCAVSLTVDIDDPAFLVKLLDGKSVNYEKIYTYDQQSNTYEGLA